MITEIFKQPSRIKEVAKDIWSMPFLTEDFCSQLTELGRSSDLWHRNTADTKFSTLDLDIKKVSDFFYKEIENTFFSYLVPQLYNEWEIDNLTISQMFMVFYSLKAQTKLGLHHDDSYISASIKLNNAYEGAELVFPRQGFSNSEVPIGNIIVWPSKVTHPHKCNPLAAGEKFSLTIWTQEK